MLLLGGYGEAGPTGDCWTFDSSTDAWAPLVLNAGSPSPYPRIDTSVCFVNSPAPHLNQVVYLFGGVAFDDEQALILNDLWRLDVTHDGPCQWTYVTEECPPAERSSHVLCAIDDASGTMLLHGGEQMGQVFGDTWLYCAATNKWLAHSTMRGVGQAPIARFGHASCSLGDGRAAIFGGIGAGEAGPEYMNDLWIFQLAAGGVDGTWAPVDMLEGIAPSPRDKPAMCAGLDGRIFIFGGYGLCVGEDGAVVQGSAMDDGDDDDDDDDEPVAEGYLHDIWWLSMPQIGATGVVQVAAHKEGGNSFVEVPTVEGWRGGRGSAAVVRAAADGSSQALVFGGFVEAAAHGSEFLADRALVVNVTI
jgi:hypothetical protein